MMSICDGQVVLRPGRDASTQGVVVDPQLSVSRIGSRAFYPAMETLAPAVRFELAQVGSGVGGGEGGGMRTVG